MKEPIVLDAASQSILQQLETERSHFFVTGKAGTGKSTLLQLFKKTTRKKVVVLSPTGISALHVKGQTIHSFFRFPPKLLIAGEIHLNKQMVSMMKALEVIIIDEISMVRADVMDAIDFCLRQYRKNALPFGGVQMIMFGDLFQLPPVVSSQEERMYFKSIYEGVYFFNAHVWQEASQIHLIELTKVYRQNERNFIRLLDTIRMNQADFDDLESLNDRYLPEALIEDPFLTLCSTNDAANRINKERMESLLTPSHFYHGTTTGDFNPKLYPADYKLELRVGAQIMLVRNDMERRFVNGTLATVMSLDEDKVTVELESEAGNKEILDLPKMIWENTRYSFKPGEANSIQSEVAGTFTQFPVRLAWAVTIHKSQGKTYDRVAIDFGKGAFEYGQAYVALSRCRTLQGVFLKKRLQGRDIMTDEKVVEFYESLRH